MNNNESNDDTSKTLSLSTAAMAVGTGSPDNLFLVYSLAMGIPTTLLVLFSYLVYKNPKLMYPLILYIIFSCIKKDDF